MSDSKSRMTWRSPILGEARELDLPAGRIRYFDVGSGPTIVFVHGVIVNANLWRKLVERLAPDHRCVVLELPVGAHTLPLSPDADLGPIEVASLVADSIEKLELDDVTLVGSDSGGAFSQIVITTRPERIGRLVLASCDYRDNFPPKLFSYFHLLGVIPGSMWLVAQTLRLRVLRKTPIAFGWIAKRPMGRQVEDSYALPLSSSAGVRRDLRRLIRKTNKTITNQAADLLPGFNKPALIAWSDDDRVFPKADAERLAADLPDSRLEYVKDSYTFSMEDNPEQLATMIREFIPVSAAA